MADVLTPEQRKHCMSRIRGRDTAPELIVRRLIHSLGYRYRLHVRDLAGRPDIVFKSRKKIIFVNGCFWHRHRCKAGKSSPSTRREFWEEKFEKNKARDKKNISKLRRQGWKVLVIWECQIKKSLDIERRLSAFLDG